VVLCACVQNIAPAPKTKRTILFFILLDIFNDNL
jgi:hypothetical protein